jgi:chorismate mutase
VLTELTIPVLIERAQFSHNPIIYRPGEFEKETNFKGSWVEWFLLEIETFHCMFTRVFAETPLTRHSKGS